MWLHAAFAVVILAAAGVWLTFGGRDPSPDPLYSRDALMAEGALIVESPPAASREGFRIAVLPGEGLTWTRLLPGGEEAPDLVVRRGSSNLVRLGQDCFVRIDGLDLPFLPGITEAQRLKRTPGVRLRGDLAEYHIGEGTDRREVREDLFALGSHGRISVRITNAAGEATTFDIRRPTAQEREAARKAISTSTESETALLQVQLRFVSRFAGSPRLAYPLAVARDCPSEAALLVTGREAGAPGPRAVPFPLSLLPGDPSLLVNAQTLPLPIDSAAERILATAATGRFGDVRVQGGRTFAVDAGAAGVTVLQVRTCRPASFFAC